MNPVHHWEAVVIGEACGMIIALAYVRFQREDDAHTWARHMAGKRPDLHYGYRPLEVGE
jgi:hypothetical protein